MLAGLDGFRSNGNCVRTVSAKGAEGGGQAFRRGANGASARRVFGPADPFSDLPEPEPSRLTAFSGGRLDRRSEARDAEMVREALASPSRLSYAVAGGRVVLRDGQALHDVDSLAPLDPDPDETVLLGFDPMEDDAPRLAVNVRADPEALPSPYEAVAMRPLYMGGALAADRYGAIALGGSLLSWVAATRHCGRCGTRTRLEAGGLRRECPSCGFKQFPRTDPVAIMLPISADGSACVLGRSPHFTPGMVSCLAGFIEPGETLEDAVRRETREEAGVETGRVRYLASQPWPMPHSLMIGCFVEARGEVAFDATELEACRWYTREEARAILKGKHENTAPPMGAIANLIITAFAEGLPESR